MITVITKNGPTTLTPINCEITGQWLGWMTVLDEDAIRAGCTPAYISFDIVDEDGNQLKDISYIDSF